VDLAVFFNLGHFKKLLYMIGCPERLFCHKMSASASSDFTALYKLFYLLSWSKTHFNAMSISYTTVRQSEMWTLGSGDQIDCRDDRAYKCYCRIDWWTNFYVNDLCCQVLKSDVHFDLIKLYINISVYFSLLVLFHAEMCSWCL